MTFTIWPFFRLPSFLLLVLAALYTASFLTETVALVPCTTAAVASGARVALMTPSFRLDSLQKPCLPLSST